MYVFVRIYVRALTFVRTFTYPVCTCTYPCQYPHLSRLYLYVFRFVSARILVRV